MAIRKYLPFHIASDGSHFLKGLAGLRAPHRGRFAMRHDAAMRRT
jgi:hypothetical protein